MSCSDPPLPARPFPCCETSLLPFSYTKLPVFRYEASIQTHAPIDLFLGGLGPSGHIAFNEPFSSLSSRTRPIVLAPSTIAANARFFANDLAEVPRMALTVGVSTIMESREVAVIASGVNKGESGYLLLTPADFSH